MEIKCKRDDIKKALSIVGKYVSAKSVNPIHQYVMVIATNNTLELRTDNMETSIRHTINNAEITEEGKMVCPETKIASIIKEWPCEEVLISEHDRKCVIEEGESHFTIMCVDTSLFPEVKEFPDIECIEIDRAALSGMITKVIFIGLGWEGRHGQAGIFMKIDNNNLVMAANDGRRLAEAKAGIKNTAAVTDKCILPVKSMSLVLQTLKALPDVDVVKIKIQGSHCYMSLGTTILRLCTLQGQYPDYKEIIPKNNDKRVLMDKALLASCVSRTKIMTTDEYKLVKFTFIENLLEIRCTSPDVGESKVDMPIDYTGDAFKGGLNPEYVLGFLKTADCETVQLECSDSKTAGLFKAGPSFMYIIMPMALK